MDNSIYNKVRCAINQIHQYDESTNLRGEELDGELKEVRETNKALREKVSKLREKRLENESNLEEASLRKQMAKRSFDQKAAFVCCLEAEAERLNTRLTQQEHEGRSYLDATKEGNMSDLIESFKGIQLEKVTEFDDISLACNKKRNLIAEVDTEIKEVASNESKLEEMKESLASKEIMLEATRKIHQENQLKIKQLNSSNATLSGERQYLEELCKKHELELNEFKANLKVCTDNRDKLSKELKEQEDGYIISLEKYKELEANYEEKLCAFEKLKEDIQVNKKTLNDLKQAKYDLELRKNAFVELSNEAADLENRVEILQRIEEERKNVMQEIENIKNECDSQQNLLNASRENLSYHLTLKKEVDEAQEELSLLTKDGNDLICENNNLSSELENLDRKIEEINAALSALKNAILDSKKAIENKEDEISDKELNIQHLMVVQGQVETQQQRITELEGNILQLKEYENNVVSEIQDQGKVESDKMNKDIAETQSRIEEMQESIITEEWKLEEMKQGYDSRVAAIKAKSNENISKAVEQGKKDIDIEMKQIIGAGAKTNLSKAKSDSTPNRGMLVDTTSEESSSDSDPFTMADSSSDEGMASASQEGKLTLSSVTPGRQKRLLTTKAPVPKPSIQPTTTTLKDAGPSSSITQNGKARLGGETPGRQKRLLTARTPIRKPSVQPALTPLKNVATSSSVTQNEKPRQGSEILGSQKELLTAKTPINKPSAQPTTTSLKHDCVTPSLATPGSRRERKRLLPKTPSNVTQR